MINSYFFCLPTVLFYIGFISTEYVPVPDNVRVSSLDLGLQLTWDPPKTINDKHFKYTAELRDWKGVFDAVCINTSSLSCDFTDNVTAFGIYHLRVRAELNRETSEWVETGELKLDEITEISAPRVELKSRKGKIEVNITDPPMRKSHLRGVYNKVSYLVHYWKEGEVTKERPEEQNRFMLSELDPQVNYCVQVAVVFLDNKSSHSSNVTCIYNTYSDEVEQWFIAVVLLVSFGVVFIGVVLVFLAVWYTYKVCRMMHPDVKLPEHLKQYLFERPPSSMLLAVPSKEKVYEVSILHEESQSTQRTNEPIRVQEKQEDCWMTADMKQRDEEQRLLDKTTV
ncbi:cytokine receptor family member b4 isoform X2 [Misgurnus anguillicaudatus]|uniref:cytokine receptor family member b4 isoform X2 n=1 Tax=Misgurnus anguillicaudatus TaxID=75329 RepID=UPI003CCEFFFC